MGIMNNQQNDILEVSQEKLRLLDTEQLLAFYGIFGTLNSPKAKAMVKSISRELKRRKYTLGEENLNEIDVKGLLRGLAKGAKVAGKTLKTAIKVGYPIAKDMVKATWMTAKKVGGAIGDLMDDPEFRKLFTKYIDNPEDPNRAKKIQAYTDSMLSSSPLSGFESVDIKLQKSRIQRACLVVLGEGYDEDFIYEDVDFTKPSAIKEAYEIFEVSADWIIYDRKTGKQLSPSKSWRKWQGAKMAAAKIGGDAEVSDKAWYHDNKAKLMGEASEKELNRKDLEKMIKNPDPKRVKSYGGTKYVDMLKSKLAKLKETVDLEEATELYKKGKITLTKFAMGKGKGAGLQINYGMKFIQIPEKEIKQLAQGITYVTKSVSQFKEDVELEEAVKFWTVTITKKAGKLFKGQTVDVKARNSAEAIKKGLKQMKADPNTVPSGSVDAVLGESIEESNKDKYMWGDINNAMSSSGLNPRVIMNVLSKLKGKTVK